MPSALNKVQELGYKPAKQGCGSAFLSTGILSLSSQRGPCRTTRLSGYEVQDCRLHSPPSMKCNVLRESLSEDSKNMYSLRNIKEKGVVSNLCISLQTTKQGCGYAFIYGFADKNPSKQFEFELGSPRPRILYKNTVCKPVFFVSFDYNIIFNNLKLSVSVRLIKKKIRARIVGKMNQI